MVYHPCVEKLRKMNSSSRM